MITLDVLPHPITTEGRYTEKFEVVDGTTIAALLSEVTAESDDFAIILDGDYIPAAEWAEQELSDSLVLQVRRTVQGDDSNPIAVILTIVILIYAPQLAGVFFEVGTAAYFGATAVIGFAGVLAVNTLFPPRTPDADSGDGGEIERQYSIAAGSNPVRTFQPLLLILGEHRVFPDFASLPYTELTTSSKDYGGSGALAVSDDEIGAFDRASRAGQAFNFVGGGFYGTGFSSSAGNNSDFNAQFLYQLFDFGIGDLLLTEPMVGDTPLGDYQDVETDKAVSVTLVAGNVDSVQGQDLETAVWVSRRSPADTTKIVVNLISQRYMISDRGDVQGATNEFKVRYRLYKKSDPDSVKWITTTHSLSSPGGGKARNPVRRALAFDVTAGRYDVEVQLVSSLAETDVKLTVKAVLYSLNYYQPSVADFTGRNPFAMKVRATGQIYGTVKNFSMMAQQRVPVPQVDGSWALGVTSNPAYLMRKFWMGFYRDKNGVQQLMAGRGIPESEIDHDNLKLWAAFCVKEGLTCNLVLDRRASEREIETLIAQCGWATPTKLGGKYGVAWENSDQPMTAIYTPANIVAGSLNVVWDNEGLADEIIGNYVDSGSDFQPNTLRRTVPGVSTPFKPVTVPLRGITNGEQAAKEINRTAAAQFYNSRAITFETGLDGSRSFITRGSVVGLAHGLVGGTVGGRVVSLVSRTEAKLSVPPESLPDDGTMWIWDTDGNTTSVDFRRGLFTGAARKGNSYHEGYVTLDDRIPVAVGYDGETDEEIIRRYKVALFDTSADLVTVRVTGITPSPEGLFRIVVRDELPEYYAARVADLTHKLRPTKRRFRAIPDNSDVVINQQQWLFGEGAPSDTAGDPGDLYMDTLTITIWRKGANNQWAVQTDAVSQEQWLFGEGVPSNADGTPGDLYMDTLIATIWRKGANNVWAVLTTAANQQRWLFGEGVPSNADGDPGDLYMDTLTITIWRKGANNVWVVRARAVINQQQWLFGEGAPSDAAGDPDDLYMDTAIATIWRKDANNVWVVQARATAADTSRWYTAAVAPAATLGQDGDFYFNSATGGISRKAAGKWIFLYELDGPGSDAWLAGENEPASTLGVVGQWYFRTANGYVYEKTGAAVWTFRRDVTGRSVISVNRNVMTGVVTVLYTDGTMDTFTAKDLTITNIAIDASGNRVITFSDGSTATIPPGVGISSITRNSDTGTVTVTYTDATTGEFLLETITVTSVTTLDGGGVVVEFSDGTVINVNAPSADSVKSILRDPLTGIVAVTLTDGSTQNFLVGDGIDGSGVEYVWRRTAANSKPAAPSTSAAQRKLDLFVPSGWTDEETGTDPTFRYEWVSTRIGSTGNWGAFRGPARIGSHQQALADIVYRAWSSGITYAFGDTVWLLEVVTGKLIQSYYICKLAHTSSSTRKPPNSTYWATAVSTVATSAIRALTLTVLSGSQLHVAWKAPTSGAPPFTYDIDVSTNSGFSSIVQQYQNQASAEATASEITLTGLAQNTRYYVRVRAKDSGNVAGAWVSKNATTLVTLVALGDVVNPVVAVSSTGIKISWGAPLTGSAPILYFVIRKRYVNQILSERTVVGYQLTATSMTDTAAVRGERYNYSVFARNSLGQSATSIATPASIIRPVLRVVTLTNTSLQMYFNYRPAGLGGSQPSAPISATHRLVFSMSGDVFQYTSSDSGQVQLHSATDWVRPSSVSAEYEFNYTVTAGTGNLNGSVTAGDWHGVGENGIVFVRFLNRAQIASSVYVDRVLTVKIRKVGTTAVLATGVYRWTKPASN